MEATSKSYDHLASIKRIDDILALPAGSFEESKTLPSRDRLTFNNGFYANCAAIFIDIRRSSDLPKKYQRPQLARIYRAFISEMVAVVASHSEVREVNIVGDCVWAVVNTPLKVDIDELFSVAAKAHVLVHILNHKLSKKGYRDPVAIGIGLDYGRALMIKAGYAGSGINDVVYMGDVVNQAAKLASKGDSANWLSAGPICLGDDIYGNLSDDNKVLCKVDFSAGCYKSNAVNIVMNDWLKAQSTT